jgi:hypothetical protein
MIDSRVYSSNRHTGSCHRPGRSVPPSFSHSSQVLDYTIRTPVAIDRNIIPLIFAVETLVILSVYPPCPVSFRGNASSDSFLRNFLYACWMLDDAHVLLIEVLAF